MSYGKLFVVTKALQTRRKRHAFSNVTGGPDALEVMNERTSFHN